MKTKLPIKGGRGRRSVLCASQVGDDLEVFELDRRVQSDQTYNHLRRSVAIHRLPGQPCGFTLQSYAVFRKSTMQTELLTYVDYVKFNGPAYHAGLRCGDVIVSVDGTSVDTFDHMSLVNFIKNSPNAIIRLVVLYDDCCRKIDLHSRSLRLERLLSEKLFELHILDRKEQDLLSRGLNSFPTRSSNSQHRLEDVSIELPDQRWKTSKEKSVNNSGYNKNIDRENIARTVGSSSYDNTCSSDINKNNAATAVTTDTAAAAFPGVAAAATTATTAAGGGSVRIAPPRKRRRKKTLVFDCEMYKDSLLWTLNPPPSSNTPPPNSKPEPPTFKSSHQRSPCTRAASCAADRRRGSYSGSTISRHGSVLSRRRRASVSVGRLSSFSKVLAGTRRGSQQLQQQPQQQLKQLRAAGGVSIVRLRQVVSEYISLVDETTRL